MKRYFFVLLHLFLIFSFQNLQAQNGRGRQVVARAFDRLSCDLIVSSGNSGANVPNRYPISLYLGGANPVATTNSGVATNSILSIEAGNSVANPTLVSVKLKRAPLTGVYPQFSTGCRVPGGAGRPNRVPQAANLFFSDVGQNAELTIFQFERNRTPIGQTSEFCIMVSGMPNVSQIQVRCVAQDH